MQTQPPIVDWSAGELAYISEGEYSGSYARIWEVKAAENKAVVSLYVFRENVPFEVDLSCLQKRSPRTKPSYGRALLLSCATAIAGPALLSGYLVILCVVEGAGLRQMFSDAVVEFAISLPFWTSMAAAAYVGFRVLTDLDPLS